MRPRAHHGLSTFVEHDEARLERAGMKTIFTIGYEGSNPSEVLSTLQINGVELLIDVRDVPISRKPGFSKTALAQGLANIGIKYLHLKGLGDPKPGRLAAREGRYSDFRRIFKSHMLTTAAQQAFSEAISAATKSVACLLCFEQDHTNCHRCIVAESMVQTGKFSLFHLTAMPSVARNIRGQATVNGRTTAHIG
jgi:uncharacterized protein (DUF488 family)